MDNNKIVSIIQRIELLLSLKDYNTLWQEDNYKYPSAANDYTIQIDEYGGQITFPHENDYSTIRQLELHEQNKTHILYELWVNNIKYDFTLVLDIWEDEQGFQFGIVTTEVM